MGKYFNIEVTGHRKLVKTLKKLGNEAEKPMLLAAFKGAEAIKTEIQRRAPQDKGDLKRSGFTVKRGSLRNGAVNAVVTLTRRLFEYAFYLEFGAPNRRPGGTLPARPFIRPAFMKARADAAKAFETALKGWLRRYGD